MLLAHSALERLTFAVTKLPNKYFDENREMRGTIDATDTMVPDVRLATHDSYIEYVSSWRLLVTNPKLAAYTHISLCAWQAPLPRSFGKRVDIREPSRREQCDGFCAF